MKLQPGHFDYRETLTDYLAGESRLNISGYQARGIIRALRISLEIFRPTAETIFLPLESVLVTLYYIFSAWDHPQVKLTM